MGRRETISVLLALACALAVGCSGEPGRMLHERPAFEGEITVQSDTLSLAGELVFDRLGRHCQLTRRQPTTVVLGRDQDGKLFAFEEARPRPMHADEERQLRVVLALVDGSGLTAARTHDDGYSVQIATHGRVRVTLRERAAGPHGHRR